MLLATRHRTRAVVLLACFGAASCGGEPIAYTTVSGTGELTVEGADGELRRFSVGKFEEADCYVGLQIETYLDGSVTLVNDVWEPLAIYCADGPSRKPFAFPSSSPYDIIPAPAYFGNAQAGDEWQAPAAFGSIETTARLKVLDARGSVTESGASEDYLRRILLTASASCLPDYPELECEEMAVEVELLQTADDVDVF